MKVYAVLLCSVLLWGPASFTEIDDAAENERVIAGGINQFSKRLYQVLIEGTNNLVVSPFSVGAVLAMLLLGLHGDTERRVSQALFLPENRSQWAQEFKSILISLQASQDITLEIANKILVQEGFQVKEDFLNDTMEYFDSMAEEVDIAQKAEEVVLGINTWAANKTHDKIKNLLEPGSLSGVVMVLLNAIYFKGMWETQFEEADTRDQPFYLSSGSENYVPMMNLGARLPYAEEYDLDIQVLKLSYQGGNFSMLILLPREKTGLAELEKNLQNLDISELLSNLTDIDVQVTLPKFKILSSIDLNDSLNKVGLGELFNEGANFSGITDRGIHISKAIQKAFIEVNEEGTEAAAITELSFEESINTIASDVSFIADHPFMYMIVEEEMGSILFMGRVMDPQE